MLHSQGEKVSEKTMVSQPKHFRTPLFSQGSFEFSLNLPEWTALGTSIGGSVLGILLQQGMLAISSLSISGLGLSLVNRHRTEQHLKRQLDQQASCVQQIKEDQKQTAACSELQRLQEQIAVINSNTSQQLQGLETLQKGINSLQDSPSNWEQVQDQLEKLQTTLDTYLSNPAPSAPTPINGRGRVAIFIDHGNLEHTAKDLEISSIDYKALLETLKQDSPLAGAWLYISVDTKCKKQPSFLNALRKKGYEIVQKPMIRRSDGSCKGNLDVELALNLVAFANQDQYDTAILVSGDGDFTSAVKQVQAQGKKVEVVSASNYINNDLKKIADRFISLKPIKDQIDRVAAA